MFGSCVYVCVCDELHLDVVCLGTRAQTLAAAVVTDPSPHNAMPLTRARIDTLLLVATNAYTNAGIRRTRTVLLPRIEQPLEQRRRAKQPTT